MNLLLSILKPIVKKRIKGLEFRDEQLELLKVENELLRKKVLMLREEAGHIR